MSEIATAKDAIAKVLDEGGNVLICTGPGCSSYLVDWYRQKQKEKGYLHYLAYRLKELAAYLLCGSALGWRRYPETAWAMYLRYIYPPMWAYEKPKSAGDTPHEILAKFERKFRDKYGIEGSTQYSFTYVTTNVDSMHQRSQSTNVLEVHGTTAKHRCQAMTHTIECIDPKKIKFTWADDEPETLLTCSDIKQHEEVTLSMLERVRCDMCQEKGLVSNRCPRPECVFHLERMPDETWIRAQMVACSLGNGSGHDLFISIGMNGVHPASLIPEIGKRKAKYFIEFNNSSSFMWPWKRRWQSGNSFFFNGNIQKDMSEVFG